MNPERLERISRNVRLTAEIAAALGPAWTPRPYTPKDGNEYEPDPREHWTDIDGPRGTGLRLHWDGWNQKGRVSISGEYPTVPGLPTGHSGRGHKRNDEDWPTITAAVDRGPEAIAAEVRRRVLPGYAPLFGIIRGRLEECAAEHQAALELETSLAEAAGARDERFSARPGGHRYAYGFSRRPACASIGFYGSDRNDIHLEARIRPDTAAAILRLIREMEPAAAEEEAEAV